MTAFKEFIQENGLRMSDIYNNTDIKARTLEDAVKRDVDKYAKIFRCLSEVTGMTQGEVLDRLREIEEEMKMVKVESIEQLEENGFVLTEQEREIIKMALKQEQDIYQGGVDGTVLSVVINDDEFPLVTISKAV